jgi:hypothetical protein
MSKKIVKNSQDEVLSDFMASLSLKLDELNNNIITRISHMEDKIDMIVKRQTDIEDRISYRVEKNSNNMSDTDSKDCMESRVIVLKDKTETKSTTKKTKKKVETVESTQANKRGNITMRVYKDVILLTGQTFDRKELIKHNGGKWDNKNMGWTVPIGKEDKLKVELERYTESLDYDELDEYLNEPVAVVKKSATSSSSTSSFNTCQIVDSDDD